jgi:phenylpyruvate tautomerase PptA (4-oxalocrotonate tautomerase family)
LGKEKEFNDGTNQNFRFTLCPAGSAATHFHCDSSSDDRSAEFAGRKTLPSFLPLDADAFFFPPDRSERYTIVEISMFAGREIATKKALIRRLFEEMQNIGIEAQDLEITIFETPRENWGIRGQCGDELQLNYRVEV